MHQTYQCFPPQEGGGDKTAKTVTALENLTDNFGTGAGP